MDQLTATGNRSMPSSLAVDAWNSLGQHPLLGWAQLPSLGSGHTCLRCWSFVLLQCLVSTWGTPWWPTLAITLDPSELGTRSRVFLGYLSLVLLAFP